MRRVGVLCALVLTLAAAGAEAAVTPRPSGLPRAIPGWAWTMYAWHASSAPTRGARPAAPRRLPAWYWLWRTWRASMRPRIGPTNESAAVYDGIGTWVDIFDTGVLSKPESSAAAMSAHGVSTLFLETSNSKQKADLVRPDALGALLEAAHAYGIHVVGWYLPTLTSPELDLRRALGAIAFRSPAGDAFDSFALDIESSAVRAVALRNTRLLSLADSLRVSAPAGYALGAIVPSPVGMQIHPTYWPDFPWTQLAQDFDAFVPMAYYTYRPRKPDEVYRYAADVIDQIRAATGAPQLPIHIAGGIAGRSTAAAAASFVQAASDCGATGTSLYDFATTTPRAWDALAAFAPAANVADC
jgi:hypothetical protein